MNRPVMLADPVGDTGHAQTTGLRRTVDSATPRHRKRTLPGLRDVSALQVAGLASVGAALIHAAMISGHGEHPSVARLFVVAAAAQLAGGLLALVHGGRWAAWLVTLVNGAAVSAWAMTRISGISWIEGLEHPESPRFIDTVCRGPRRARCHLRGAGVGQRASSARHRLGVPAAAIGALAVLAMMQGATRIHSHGAHDSGGGHEHATADTARHIDTDDALDDHPHAASHDEATAPPGEPRSDGHHHPDAAGNDDTHQTAPLSTKPYDPTQPIDLSGVAGVTSEQQAFAENLVAVTVVRLPQWADPAVAEAAGFHSIGDGITGHEHYVQWDWIDDEIWLDPDAPESLVYEVQPDGAKTLVSAMYMLPATIAVERRPRLRRTADAMAHPRRSLPHRRPRRTHGRRAHQSRRNLPSTALKLPTWPMIHVWITPTPCGPFAALDGIAAGQILPGQQRWCDHAHLPEPFGSCRRQ